MCNEDVYQVDKRWQVHGDGEETAGETELSELSASLRNNQAEIHPGNTQQTHRS